MSTDKYEATRKASNQDTRELNITQAHTHNWRSTIETTDAGNRDEQHNESSQNPVYMRAPRFVDVNVPHTPILSAGSSDSAFAIRIRQAISSKSQRHLPPSRLSRRRTHSQFVRKRLRNARASSSTISGRSRVAIPGSIFPYSLAHCRGERARAASPKSKVCFYLCEKSAAGYICHRRVVYDKSVHDDGLFS